MWLHEHGKPKHGSLKVCMKKKKKITFQMHIGPKKKKQIEAPENLLGFQKAFF
jgi:hypothetical protein